jgi:hypothetical protein
MYIYIDLLHHCMWELEMHGCFTLGIETEDRSALFPLALSNKFVGC